MSETNPDHAAAAAAAAVTDAAVTTEVHVAEETAAAPAAAAHHPTPAEEQDHHEVVEAAAAAAAVDTSVYIQPNDGSAAAVAAVDEAAAAPEDPAAAAAAAAAVAAAASMQANNKWSKNGFGAPVATRQTGKFTKAESEIVRQSIEQFCAAKQIGVARLCSECDHKAELKGAWMEIAKSLPHRSVQSVYRHGIRRCHPWKRGAWSEAEAATLADLVQRMGKKWSSIQAKLNRSADSCRDKYREMSEDFIKGRWREQETELLKRYIREHLNAEPNADIKELGKMVEEQRIQIPWSAISKKMGKRSRLSCFKKWQKMTGILAPMDELAGTKRTAEQVVAEVAATTGAEPDLKRAKMTEEEAAAANEKLVAAAAAIGTAQAGAPSFSTGVTAGAAAAAMAAPATAGDYDIYSAKMAAETVEAVELPDTDTLVPRHEI